MNGFLLQEAYVHRFGKLFEYTYTFQEGINVINEENGWGKTTFAVFLKAMLFGLEYSRTTKTITERKRYMPYKGGIFGGTLTFSNGEKSYRIERYFGKTEKEDTFALYDLSTNLPSSDYSSNIGEEIWEVDRGSYEKTSFITLEESEFISDIISRKLGDIDEQEADVEQSSNALKLLEKAMVSIQTKRGSSGLLGVVKRECAELERRKRDCLFALKEAGSLETNQWLAQRQLVTLDEEEVEWEEKLQDLSIAGKQEHYQTLLLWVEQVEKEYKRVNSFFNISIPTEEKLLELERVVGEQEKQESLYEEYGQDSQEYLDCKNQIDALEIQIEKLDADYAKSEWNDLGEQPTSKFVDLVRILSAIIIGTGFVMGIIVSPLIGILLGVIGVLLLGVAFMKKREDNRIREAEREQEIEVYARKYEEEKQSFVKRKEEIQRLYTSVEKEGENRINQINMKLKITNKKLQTMFSEYCKWDEDISPREILNKLRETVKEVDYLRKQVVKHKFVLQQFKDENDVSLLEQGIENVYTLEEIQQKKKVIANEKKTTMQRLTNLTNDYKVQSGIADQLEDVKAELADKLEQRNALEEEYNLLKCTFDCLNIAKDQLAAAYKEAMEEAFQEYLSKIEQKEYKEYEINIRLNILHYEEGKLREYYTLSKGKKDLVGICLRMALMEAVYKNVDNPVIIMDDPFVNFDDERLQSAMSFLEEVGERYQVIYFVCHNSRKPSSNDWL